MSETFERIVEFSPAFDKRHSDPSKNYGIGAVLIRFVLKGERGAVQFLIGTEWYPEHVQREPRFRPLFADSIQPKGWDIGYHSPVAQYEGQAVIHDACPYLDGQPCYYDGSGLHADEFIPTFLDGGSDAVWTMLERRYNELFHAGASA